MKRASIQFFVSSSLPCLAALSVPATAQAVPEQDRSQIADIIVTAERRTSSVQSTPLAISAVTGDSLQSQQVSNIESLTTKLPTVTFSRSGGDARVFIRGIGLDSITPGSDPRVAIYTDGAYNARVQAALGSFFDVERVEVLSGPQGTLYGRNATAGAINIISRDPGEELNGYGRLTFGNYSAVRAEGAIGIPLSADMGLRVAFQTSDRSGFGKNIVTGEDVDDEQTRAVRARFKARSGALTVTLQGDYFREDDHTGGYHYFGTAPGSTLFATKIGGTTPANFRDFAGPGPATQVESYGATGTLDYDLGGLTLTSISAYKHIDSHSYTSPDGSTLAGNLLPLDIVERSNSYTQELRLGGKIGMIDMVVGAYYFHEKNFAGNNAGVNTIYFGGPDFLTDGSVNRGNQVTNAYALFTQNVINVTDKLGIDIGARYSSEKRRDTTINRFNLSQPYTRFPFFQPNPVDRVFNGSRSWSSFDPKIGVHYKASQDLFLYASYSTGFKSGGFNVAFIQPAFDPEEIEDYEAGIKADLFDRHVRVNLAAFLYKYKNLQVNTTGGNLGTQLITQNAARAELKGVEMNLTARPVEDFVLNLDVAYLDAKFQDYTTGDPSGIYVGGIPLPNPSYSPAAWDGVGGRGVSY